jgi:hypothetical protein
VQLDFFISSTLPSCQGPALAIWNDSSTVDIDDDADFIHIVTRGRQPAPLNLIVVILFVGPLPVWCLLEVADKVIADRRSLDMDSLFLDRL